jgi:hypothetical protein
MRISKDNVGYQLLVRAASSATCPKPSLNHVLLTFSIFQVRQGWSGRSGLGKNETG